MAFFNINNTYKTINAKGLATDSKGRLSISENKSPHGKVLPEQELVYLGKKVEGWEGVHAFRLPDGRMVKGHRNHFDATTPYNTSKARQAENGNAQPGIQVSAAERLAALEEQRKQLEALVLEEEQAAQAAAEAEAQIEETEESNPGDEDSEVTESEADFDLSELVETEES